MSKKRAKVVVEFDKDVRLLSSMCVQYLIGDLSRYAFRSNLELMLNARFNTGAERETR